MTKLERIEKLEQELTELKAECAKSIKYEIEYEEGNTYYIGDYDVYDGWPGTNQRIMEHAKYRKTKEGAEQALELNKRVNRLHSLAEDLGGLKEFVYYKKNWYIYMHKGVWEYTLTYDLYEPDKVYMTEECAKKIADMLNNGEYEL